MMPMNDRIAAAKDYLRSPAGCWPQTMEAWNRLTEATWRATSGCRAEMIAEAEANAQAICDRLIADGFQPHRSRL